MEFSLSEISIFDLLDCSTGIKYNVWIDSAGENNNGRPVRLIKSLASGRALDLTLTRPR